MPAFSLRSHPSPLRNRRIAALAIAVVLLLVLGVAAAYAGYITRRVNTDAWGAPVSGLSGQASISSNGRYVVFSSNAWGLVPGDTNGVKDVFLKDRTTGAIYRVNVSSQNAQATGAPSTACDVSGDGRYVIFSSGATNLLVSGDTNGLDDIYIFDRQTFVTKRANLSTQNLQANGVTQGGRISPDGVLVGFNSDATNLEIGDNNLQTDAFVRTTVGNQTTRVSKSKTGVQGDGESRFPCVSNADATGARFVAFQSMATNLIDGQVDNDNKNDIFVKNLLDDSVERITVDKDGLLADGDSELADISANGRYVVFKSWATDLVSTPADTNGVADIYLRDRLAQTTKRVSLSSAGVQPDLDCENPSVSADGRFVCFWSAATNLVPGDTNTDGDVFIRDMLLNKTSRISVSDAGAQGDNWSEFPDIDANARVAVYSASATNLVADDFNNTSDIFSTVLPLPAVQLNPAVAPPAVYAGKAFTAYATMRPRHTAGTYPVRIYKYRYVNGVWRSYGYVNAKAANGGTTIDPWSKCSVSMKLPYRGRWRLRSYAPGDSMHSATWSASYRYVTVK